MNQDTFWNNDVKTTTKWLKSYQSSIFSQFVHVLPCWKCKNYIFCVFFFKLWTGLFNNIKTFFKSRSRGQGQGHVTKVKVTWSNSRSCDQGLVTVTQYHMLNSLKRREMLPHHHKVTWQKLRSRDFLWSRDLVMVTWPYLRARSRNLDLSPTYTFTRVETPAPPSNKKRSLRAL